MIEREPSSTKFEYTETTNYVPEVGFTQDITSSDNKRNSKDVITIKRNSRRISSRMLPEYAMNLTQYLTQEELAGISNDNNVSINNDNDIVVN